MKKIISIMLVLSIILALPSCALFGGKTIDGDKNVLERTYKLEGTGEWTLDVSDITYGGVNSDVMLYVKTGSQYGSALKIATDDNVFSSLTVTIDEAERVIKVEGDEEVKYNPSEFAITLGVPVNSINLSGGYVLEMLVDSVKSLRVDLEGAASANIITERLSSLEFETEGASEITLEGSADQLLFDGEGVVTLDAFKYEAVNANISLEGASSAKINVTGELYVSADGTCSIEYKGDPEIKSQQINGLSTLTQAD